VPDIKRFGIERVAVVRMLPGLGDLLCLVPALRSIRAGLPDVRISLLGLPTSRWMLSRYAALVDEVVAVEWWPGIPEANGTRRSWLELAAGIRRGEFDLVFQLHGDGSVLNSTMRVFPDATIVTHHLDGARPAPRMLSRPWPVTGHEAVRLKGLCEWVGLPEVPSGLCFPLTTDDDAEAADLHLPVNGYALVHPGASRPDRRWAADGFAALADGLAGRGLPVVLTGTSLDGGAVAKVDAAMRFQPVRLEGRTSLGALGALLRGAVVTVCNDTGVGHLAAAVDGRAVIVVTTSDVDRWGPMPSERRVAVVAQASGRTAVDPSVRDVLDAVDRVLGA